MSDVATRRRRRRASHYRDPLGSLTVAAVAYFVALLLVVFVVPRLGTLGQPGWVTQLLAFVLVWAPLGAAVYFASERFGSRSLSRDAGLQFHGIDLGLGFLIGLVARFVAEGFAPTVRAAPLIDGQSAPPPPVELLVLAFGACLVAPLVEELFFRGALQRSVSGLVRGRRWARIVVSVTVSTLLFVLLHLASAAPAMWGAIAITTGIGGVAFGLLAAITRRLGASIVAHGVFNVLGLVFLYVR